MRPRAVPLLLAALGLVLLAGSVAGAMTLRRREGLEGRASEEACASPQEVSFPASALSLTDVGGAPVALDDLEGQVVLANTWAMWCPPCRQEMPVLEAYYRRHRAQGFVLVGINIGETADRVREFAGQYALSFPLWLDPDEQALRAFRSTALPTTLVIDRSGTVRLAWSGATCASRLESAVTPLLGP